MANVRKFLSYSTQELIALARRKEEEIASGKIATSSGAADLNAGFQVMQSPEQGLQDVYFELYLRDPEGIWKSALNPPKTQGVFTPGRQFIA